MQAVKKPNLGCCFRDTEQNRGIAFGIIDNFYNLTGEKYYLISVDRKLQTRSEAELNITKILIPNIEVIEHDFR